MIKSKDTGKLVAVNWITGNATGLDKYSISAGNKPLSYTGGAQYNKPADLSLGVYNLDTYKHEYTVKYTRPCHHIKSCGGHSSHCGCYSVLETFTPSDVGYTTADYSMNIVFDRYIADNTDSRVFTVKPEVVEKNGFTTIRYQLDDTLKVYPEVGMLFDNDSDVEKVRWVVGEQDRLINPVVWQTLEHKVYVTPKSTGTSVSNDSRALAASKKLLGVDNTSNGKQMIYKGAAVNTAFEVNRDDSATKSKGILTFKTYALDFKSDFSTGTTNNLKNTWGNGSYNSYEQHSVVLDYLTKSANNKATATERLIVDSGASYGNIDYEGGERSQKTGSYNLISYKGNTNKVPTKIDGVATGVDTDGEAVVFEHGLIIRGGALVGIHYNTRTKDAHGNWKILDLPIQSTTGNSLEREDEALYNAVVGMGLYNVSNGLVNRANNVLCGFEYQTGKPLYEEDYAKELATAREQVDKVATPPTSAIYKDSGWYSEDSTVLVIKEYVSNFEVPSISFSDKLSMSVKGLETPADKAKFFNVVGKGYTYLEYVLPICSPYKSSSGKVVPTSKAYFEFSSSPAKKLGFGRIGVDYIVPNVSVSDTTRMN